MQSKVTENNCIYSDADRELIWMSQDLVLGEGTIGRPHKHDNWRSQRGRGIESDPQQCAKKRPVKETRRGVRN
ncbi:unnamed protein product [Urochloa humidicola]